MVRAGGMEVLEDFFEHHRRGTEVTNCHYHNDKKHWTELEAQGVPLEPSEFRWRPGGRDFDEELVIEQQGDIASNCIIEHDKYHIYYMLNVLVINRRAGAVHILEKRLGLPWDDPYLDWLPNPAAERRFNKLYVFPGKTGDDYPRSVVLNHVLLKPLRRGVVHEGLLLGIGPRPIPEAFRHGAKIDVTLTLVDQYTRQYSEKLTMCVCRAEGSHQPDRQFEKVSPNPIRRCSTSPGSLNPCTSPSRGAYGEITRGFK